MKTITLAILIILTIGRVNAADLFDEPGVADMFRDVLRRGQFGFTDVESAAFISLDSNGRYQCTAWPPTAEFHQAHYVGSMPKRVVAIVHTHPPEMPFVSSRDQYTATTLGIAVYAVSRGNVFKAQPAERPRAIIKNTVWYDSRQIKPVCALAANGAAPPTPELDLVEVCGRRLTLLRSEHRPCEW